MSLPYYLAIGSVVIEDGTETTAYKITSVAFPEPQPDGRGGHEPAERVIGLRIDASTKALVRSAVAALRRECVRDSRIYWRADSTGDVMECRIREGRVVEAVHDPVAYADSTPFVTVTVTLTTDPYWLAPWSAETTVETVTAVPGHFDISSVGGEVDALLSVRAVPSANGTGLFLGVKPEPGTGYDYVDDYGGESDTSDANALGGYKVGETVDGTLAGNEIGTAPNIDTNDNRGRHLLLARLDSSATTPASNTFKGQTTTTGNAIASSVTVDADGGVKTASSNDLTCYELGDVQIPAGQVPDVVTGSGYATEASATENTNDEGTKTLTAASAQGAYLLQAVQTFAAFTGTLTAVEYTVDSAPASTLAIARCYVNRTRGGVLSSWAADADVSAGTHKIAMPVGIEVVSTDTLSFELYLSDNAAFTIGLAFSNGDYASGALTTPTGSGEAAGDDLTFKVYGRLPLGFNTTNPVQAACSESSKTVALDFVQRIPVDYAAIAYRPGSSTSCALYYDGDTDTPYIADADGIGPSVLDKVDIRAPLRVRPGVTNRVVVGMLYGDAAPPSMSTLAYKTRARFLTATG